MLHIENLQLAIKTVNNNIYPVNKLDLHIKPGEIFVLLGESGSGKTLSALSIMRLLPYNCYYGVNSKIIFNSQIDLLELTEREMQDIRGADIGYIFQDPNASLNPLYTVRQQLTEALRDKKNSDLIKLLQEVQISDPERILNAYPHELSGGLKQRVMLAQALANQPKLLIADEPTTALDVTTQLEILKLFLNLRDKFNMSIFLITHNFSVARQVADRIGVMQAGQLVEIGSVNEIMSNPQHVYTKQLLDSIPCFAKRQQKNISNREMDGSINVQVKNLDIKFKHYHAIKNISFDIAPGEVVALVGSSGCGKTTVAKSMVNLLDSYTGQILIGNRELKSIKRHELCRLVQIIFQDPYSSLDPKMTIEQILTEGSSWHGINVDVNELLSSVGLSPEHKNRYPHEYSGGQRQRLAIARALTMQPKLLVCDEPTSALDLSVQAQILAVLRKLHITRGISYLFITHDLAVVSYIADRVLVMDAGEIVEHGTTEQILYHPQHVVTKNLLHAAGTPSF